MEEEHILLDGVRYTRDHNHAIIYEGIAIRHQPDGELYAYLKSPTFDDEHVIDLIREILKGSNNFSVEGVFADPNHSAFDNILKLFPDEKKIKNRKGLHLNFDRRHPEEYPLRKKNKTRGSKKK